MEKSQSKEYGKLSLDELKRLLEAITIPKLGELDITKRLPPIPDSKLNELAVAGYAGTWLYELPLLTHLAVLVYAFGLRRRLAGWVKQQNPQRAVLDFMNHGSMPPTGKSRKTNMTALRFIATWTLTRSIQALAIYGRSLSGLVQDVRSGDDNAFFKAVRIDRSILTCPTFAARLARAEFRHESGFFKKLRYALKGKIEKQDARYHYLRFFLALLDELGVLDKLSMEDRYKLLAEDFRLYDRTGKDPARSLDRFIARWKEAHRHEITISCRRQ